VSSADVWVEANPMESDITYLKPGAPAIVTADAYPGHE
jgi:membrane fusion protein (multidrug efflux system)